MNSMTIGILTFLDLAVTPSPIGKSRLLQLSSRCSPSSESLDFWICFENLFLLPCFDCFFRDTKLLRYESVCFLSYYKLVICAPFQHGTPASVAILFRSLCGNKLCVIRAISVNDSVKRSSCFFNNKKKTSITSTYSQQHVLPSFRMKQV